MLTPWEQLETKIQEIPLHKRLKMCLDIISELCAKGRGLTMSVPVKYTDEDVFMAVTIKDAMEQLKDFKY